MTVFRYGREHFEEGEYVRRKDAMPGDDLDPVVRIVEDLARSRSLAARWIAAATAWSTWSVPPAKPKTTHWRSASSLLS
jgi:hypothetical protein